MNRASVKLHDRDEIVALVALVANVTGVVV
jgi:hypothetical protein